MEPKFLVLAPHSSHDKASAFFREALPEYDFIGTSAMGNYVLLSIPNYDSGTHSRFMDASIWHFIVDGKLVPILW